MSANASAIAYLIATVCFILAIKGLSSPASARRGNLIGMVGMVIAVLTTLASPGVLSYGEIIAALAVGGAIGMVVALRIQMAAMPQLVGALNSLVGLAAIIVGALIAAGPEEMNLSKIVGFVAVALAAVNIFGGFAVTQRMLEMYKKK